MAKRKPDLINRIVDQVEKNATKLRKDLRRFSRNTDLPHKLDEIAGELRRGAASVAAEVEHYLHELRAPKTATAGKRRPARKKGAKKTAKRSTATAKRTRKTAAKKRTRKTAKKRARKR